MPIVKKQLGRMFENFKKRFDAREEYLIAKTMFKTDESYFREYKVDVEFAIGYLCGWYEWANYQLDICKKLNMRKPAEFWSNIVVKSVKACSEFYGEDVDLATETYTLMTANKQERKENENEI